MSCTCGRSPTGKCVGWHNLSEEDYQDKKIKSEYLDFSLSRNTMIISNNVIYRDLENTLETDVVEINIETKETIFYMYDKNKKINIINQK